MRSRLRWEQMPDGVRSLVQEHVGAVVGASSHEGGYSPGVAATLRTDSGERVFLKAVSTSFHEVSAGLYRREAQVSAVLPDSAPAPRLRWSLEHEDWVVLAFDAADGPGPAPHPWRPDELREALTLAAELAAVPAPSSEVIGRFAEADAFGDWDVLAATDPAAWVAPEVLVPGAGPGTGLPGRVHDGATAVPDRPSAVLPDGASAVVPGAHPLGEGDADVAAWAVAHVDELARLAGGWREASAGDALVHGDLRADNMVRAGGRLLAVDWPYACAGAPWLDLVGMLPSVALEGGGEPEGIWRAHPVGAGADPDAVNSYIAAIAGLFTERARLAPPPGIPHVRDFQRAQGEVALRWLRARLA